MSDNRAAQAPSSLERSGDFAGRPRRQFALITVGALAIFALLRFLPTGTNLSHMDFRVDAKNSIEFCDPLNPQFIPVVAVASPVTMTLRDAGAPSAGKETRFIATLKTSTGKSIAPVDLIVAHTKLLHLLIVDPTLTDYQHVHPEPAERAGDWTFAFTPRRSGVYRVFADFTPAATARGLYASADVNVSANESGPNAASSLPPERAGPYFAPFEQEGYRFSLLPGTAAIRAGVPVDLRFTIERMGRRGAVGADHGGVRAPGGV